MEIVLSRLERWHRAIGLQRNIRAVRMPRPASHLERKFATLVDSSNLYRGESSWRMQVNEAG
ncbi:hypothetical protein ABID65_009493, partial [Bradyrhizobium sp. S3.9.2]|uniref:hypothetical protein n=1 Tax=Bradyrhizobium sp. S3.9.2 TaxID=3156432 RepID=UPI003395E944